MLENFDCVSKNQITLLISIGNLPHVQISGLENQVQGKQEIVNLFYWVDSLKQLDQSDDIKKQLENEWPMIEKLLEIKEFC